MSRARLSKEQKTILCALALGAVVFALLNTFIDRKLSSIIGTRSMFEHTSLNRAHLHVTGEDVQPLSIPPEAIANGRAIYLPILMYHHVGYVPLLQHPDPVRMGLTVSPESFAQQVNQVARHGYHAISLEDLYQLAVNHKKLPPKPIIFTFDDGYDDVFQYAAPILKQHGFIGSFGIITQWPGNVQGTNAYANWDVIKNAAANGMEIVCHTQNHFDGSNRKFDNSYIENNLRGCQQDLQNNLGISRNHILIYPYGHYSDRYILIAKKIGFDMALTVHAGATLNLNDLMELPRIRVSSGESLDQFEKYLK